MKKIESKHTHKVHFSIQIWTKRENSVYLKKKNELLKWNIQHYRASRLIRERGVDFFEFFISHVSYRIKSPDHTRQYSCHSSYLHWFSSEIAYSSFAGLVGSRWSTIRFVFFFLQSFVSNYNANDSLICFLFFLGTTVLPFSSFQLYFDYWPFGSVFCDIWLGKS